MSASLSMLDTLVSASLSPLVSSPQDVLMSLEKRCVHMAAVARPRMGVVTAQQAAFATSLSTAHSVIERLASIATCTADKHVTGVAALVQHSKHTLKQLQLWQSMAAVTASQLLAAADLICSTGIAASTNPALLLNAAVLSHHTHSLAALSVRTMRATQFVVNPVQPCIGTGVGVQDVKVVSVSL